MAEDIEDAEWNEVPGNSGNLAKRNRNEPESTSEGFDPAAERARIKAEILEELRAKAPNSWGRRLRNVLTIAGGLLVAILLIAILSGPSGQSPSPSDPKQDNIDAFNALANGSSQTFSSDINDDGTCRTSWGIGSIETIKDHGPQVYISKMNDNGTVYAFSDTMDHIQYDGEFVNLDHPHRMIFKRMKVDEADIDHVRFKLERNGDTWVLEGNELHACQPPPNDQSTEAADAAAHNVSQPEAEAAANAANQAAAQAADEAAKAAADAEAAAAQAAANDNAKGN